MELDRGGVRLHYDVAGAGPAVLLTHGYSASTKAWAPNVAPLAVDHTVVTWDLRGHGASESPADPALYSSDHAIGDMAALLDAVGAERAVVGGHSLGGYLSLAFYLAHPERVAALLLVDTGPGYRSDEARARWNRMAGRYADELAAKGHAGLGLAGHHTLTQHDSRVVDGLASVAVPTLVVVGEDDAPFVDGSRYMANKIPNARLVVIAGAGHEPNLTNSDEFDREVRTFLDTIGAA